MLPLFRNLLWMRKVGSIHDQRHRLSARCEQARDHEGSGTPLETNGWNTIIEGFFQTGLVTKNQENSQTTHSSIPEHRILRNWRFKRVGFVQMIFSRAANWLIFLSVSAVEVDEMSTPKWPFGISIRNLEIGEILERGRMILMNLISDY